MSTNAINLRVTGVEQASAEMREAIHAGEEAGLEKVALRGVELIVPLTPVAFGVLANAIQFERTEAPMRATIFAGAPADVYAAPVETGTRPHFPPPSALVPWVIQKLGVKDEKKATSIAWAIAKTIARRGTKGAFMFQQAFDQLSAEAQGIFELELATAIRNAGFVGGQA